MLDNGKTITYKIKFLDNFRFTATSLASLLNSLSEGLHKDKFIDYKSFLEYIMFKDDQLIFRYFEYKKYI